MDDSLRRRLEALNRGPLPAPPAAGPDRPQAVPARKQAARLPVRKSQVVKPIAGLLRRGEVVRNSAGEHLRIMLPMDAFWPGGENLVAGRHEFLQSILLRDAQTEGPDRAVHAEMRALVRSFPDRTVCLDLETCGLSGAALFLVGLLRLVDGRLAIELLLARNYAEEKATIATLWETLAGCELLVTFNGKAFDWPMVLDRSVRYHLLQGAHQTSHHPRTTTSNAAKGTTEFGPHGHIDILHHARRRWKRRLPDCRLQTLEHHVCRRSRVGDIAGQQIPAAYAEFVRSGFERDMEAILYHNALDLVTLLDLALRLAA